MTILLEETVFNPTFTILRIIKEMDGNKFMCLQVPNLCACRYRITKEAEENNAVLFY